MKPQRYYTPAQAKRLLEQRLRLAYSDARMSTEPRPVDPPEVKAARKIVDKHDRHTDTKRKKAADRKRAKLDALRREAQDLMLAGAPVEEVVAVIGKIEALV